MPTNLASTIFLHDNGGMGDVPLTMYKVSLEPLVYNTQA